jgi:Bacterial SH3 domain
MASRTAHASTRSARYALGPGADLPVARTVALLLIVVPIATWVVIANVAKAGPSPEAKEIASFNPRAALADNTPHFLPTPEAVFPPEGADLTSGASVKVANTGGSGAVLRAEPPKGDRLESLREGTQLKVLERRALDDGNVWLRVRTPDGAEGWIFSRLVTRT